MSSSHIFQGFLQKCWDRVWRGITSVLRHLGFTIYVATFAMFAQEVQGRPGTRTVLTQQVWEKGMKEFKKLVLDQARMHRKTVNGHITE
jgi:hypothetical protein